MSPYSLSCSAVLVLVWGRGPGSADSGPVMQQEAQHIECFGRGDHGCLVYDSGARLAAVTASFLADGLARGERCLYSHDDGAAEPFRAALQARGLNLFDAEQSGRLAMTSTGETYAEGGRFDGRAAAAFYADTAVAARGAGYAGLRVAGSANWAADDASVVAALLDYEALVDPVLHGQGVTALCLYDRRRFADAQLCAVVRNHAVVGAHSHTCVNPLYRPGLGSGGFESGGSDLASLLADLARVDEIMARHEPDRAWRRDLHRHLPGASGLASADSLPYIVACCQCGDLRDDSPGAAGREWMRGWRWLAKHLGVDVSHGYCPSCYDTVLARFEAE